MFARIFELETLMADTARYVWHDTGCDEKAPHCSCGVLALLRRFPNRPDPKSRVTPTLPA